MKFIEYNDRVDDNSLVAFNIYNRIFSFRLGILWPWPSIIRWALGSNNKHLAICFWVTDMAKFKYCTSIIIDYFLCKTIREITHIFVKKNQELKQWDSEMFCRQHSLLFSAHTIRRCVVINLKCRNICIVIRLLYCW